MAGRTSRSQVGDAALNARTGRTWEQWLARLDRRGARNLDHKGIVALLQDDDLSPWYRQMIAVVYEQERGLRAVHEKPDGFEVSRTRTVAAPVDAVWRAWNDARQRGRWLGKVAWTVRTRTAPKSMRITWEDGRTHVGVMLTPVDGSRTRVAVQHGKLRDAVEAERRKAWWAARLDALVALLAP